MTFFVVVLFYTSISVFCVNTPGFRTVHLETRMGEPIFGAALIVHITIH